MIYQNNENVHLMIYKTKIKSCEQIIKVNVKNGLELSPGDKIIARKWNDIDFGFEIIEVLENRQSSLSNFKYLTCNAIFKQI